jgi:Tfp pilus assembly protein PilO
MRFPAAWRARWWTWALPLAVVIANAVVLAVHPGRTGAGFAEMERELDAESRALAALGVKERQVETVLAAARSSRHALDELYQHRFSTQAERLTQLITEVKRLAQRAGLEPASISYPEETLGAYGLVRMSLVFGVEGTYAQLRTLVNLLELSDLFLVLERVALQGGSESPTLRISLRISTFFVPEPDGEVGGEPRGGRPAAEGPSPEGPTDEHGQLEELLEEQPDERPTLERSTAAQLGAQRPDHDDRSPRS